MRLAQAAAVNIESLRELKSLLSASPRSLNEVVVEARHCSCEGGADASGCEVSPCDTTQTVPSRQSKAELEAVADRDPPTHGALVGSTATRTLAKSRKNGTGSAR